MSKDNPAVSENLIAAAIEAAEEIRDPLDGLVEKTAIDPGAPFASDPGTAGYADEGGPRRVRGAAGTTEESRLPGDGA